jgi:hypothetical protein
MADSNSIKTVEHSFYDYGGHSPIVRVPLCDRRAYQRIRLITGAVIPRSTIRAGWRPRDARQR